MDIHIATSRPRAPGGQPCRSIWLVSLARLSLSIQSHLLVPKTHRTNQTDSEKADQSSTAPLNLHGLAATAEFFVELD
ncbi:hypothetical protein PGT21_002638 [Puccinia graminis f. sp. tritici]|uniref:Uncharacterized protein n=1 Tax=Puccinia graminis f. sp. tritici TaxID=56615 RepID=A0A5B0P9P7_PUCGR|nr:hypothetical protein PGT21_002638 [Puccinia graminis f. sp. tritici]KAA1134339.1 hypothetical protein PGTUg99_035383 [Puccinia graminis f. sp. tritici]